MDAFHDLVQWIAGLLLALGAWTMKRLHSRVDDLEDDLSSQRLHMAENYVSKAEVYDLRQEMRKGFADTRQDVKEGMERIYDKLDSKADKQ